MKKRAKTTCHFRRSKSHFKIQRDKKSTKQL